MHMPKQIDVPVFSFEDLFSECCSLGWGAASGRRGLRGWSLGGRVGGPWLGVWWEGGLLSRFGFVLLQGRRTCDPEVLEVAAADGS